MSRPHRTDVDRHEMEMPAANASAPLRRAERIAGSH
jgi:hypothetical protein